MNQTLRIPVLQIGQTETGLSAEVGHPWRSWLPVVPFREVPLTVMDRKLG